MKRHDAFLFHPPYTQSHTPSLELMGSTLSFDSSHQDVTLFIANLTPEYDDDDALCRKMKEFGVTLRCFIGRNPAGQSKVWLSWAAAQKKLLEQQPS